MEFCWIKQTTFHRFVPQLPYPEPQPFWEITKQPLFPNKMSILSRMITFEQLSAWNMNVKQLAEAGFFYSMYHKKILCFSCGMRYTRMYDVIRYDDPMLRHCQERPICFYLNDVFGHCDTWQLQSVTARFHPELYFKRDAFNIDTIHKYVSTCNYFCIICQTNIANIILMPCAHWILCVLCVFQIEPRHCPTCRKKFDCVFRVNI